MPFSPCLATGLPIGTPAHSLKAIWLHVIRIGGGASRQKPPGTSFDESE